MSLRSRIAWITSKLLPLFLVLAGGVSLIILIGIAQRIGWLSVAGGPTNTTSSEAGTIFTCPMHPQIRQPHPGRCPICGMELVSAASGASDLNDLSVSVEPAQRRLANIQTAQAERKPLEATLQTVGAIEIDESRLATIAAYVDGRLERLFADYTGVAIAKDDHLAVLYSPQLYAAQVEFLESRRALQPNGGLASVRQAQEALIANTRQRLRELGMTEVQIGELERTRQAQSRLTIFSPQGGTVIEKLAIEGNYVQSGDPIYRIADLSSVWLVLQLFPEDAARVRFGQRVEAVVQSLPGETWTGRVAFIDPVVDPKTRTVRVRVELLNEEGRLRPGDYAEARVNLPIGPQGKVYDSDLAGKWISPMHPQIIREESGQCPICGMDLVPTSTYGFVDQPVPQPESTFVPRSAVLLAGGNSVVYVETEPGRFEVRSVTLGPILRDKIVIVEGIEPGESVATAGNFLIDSQMQLAGKPSLIDPSRAIASRSLADSSGPLKLERVEVTSVAGPAGEQLHALYAAYFDVHASLAADQPVPPPAAQALHRAARALTDEPTLPAPIIRLAGEIAAESEHLHHVELPEARKQFKPISHAVVRLASQWRGAESKGSYKHFFCPMVEGGGGDWLQATDKLLNPYFGSEMLRCGEKVHEFPAASQEAVQPSEGETESEPPSDHGDHSHDGRALEPKGA